MTRELKSGQLFNLPAVVWPAATQEKKPDPDLEERMQWLNVISHPSVVLILGARGSGKSAAGYRILEHLRHIADLYVVALPQKARKLLPDWIGNVPSIEGLPQDSVGLVDESYTLFHSRGSSSDKARSLSNRINLSRHKGVTLIFVSQEARQVDKNIVSSADAIIFKNPGILQFEFERRELRRIAEEAGKMFDALGGKSKHRSAYVFAPRSNFIGMLENSLPSFWTPSLSKAYADSVRAEEMTMPEKVTLDQKRRKAKELRRGGWSYSRIARYFGISRSTAFNWVHDYPYTQLP